MGVRFMITYSLYYKNLLISSDWPGSFEGIHLQIKKPDIVPGCKVSDLTHLIYTIFFV